MPRKPKYDRDVALEKAVNLFWKRGFHASSLKHIEQALDMRPGSLYATFGSKEDLFGEAMDLYSARMAEALNACQERASDGLEAIGLYLHQLGQACADPEAYDMAAPACMILKTLLETADDAALSHRADGKLNEVEKRLTAILQDAQRQGALKADADPGRLARWVQLQIMGLRTFAQRNVNREEIEALVDDSVAVLELYRVHSPKA